MGTDSAVRVNSGSDKKGTEVRFRFVTADWQRILLFVFDDGWVESLSHYEAHAGSVRQCPGVDLITCFRTGSCRKTKVGGLAEEHERRLPGCPASSVQRLVLTNTIFSLLSQSFLVVKIIILCFCSLLSSSFHTLANTFSHSEHQH